jgi:hypothetical protein
MLEHGGGGVREGGPLAFHLGGLVVSVRGRKLGSVSQRRYHGAASNIKVVRITIELDGGPESTSMVHARVQVPYVYEDGRNSGDTCFLGWEFKDPNVVGRVINYTKNVFGSPRPGLLESAEDIKIECLIKASCRLSVGLSVDRGMVQFG